MFHQVPGVVQKALTPVAKRTLPTWERLESRSSYDQTSRALIVDPYILHRQLRRKFALSGRAGNPHRTAPAIPSMTTTPPNTPTSTHKPTRQRRPARHWIPMGLK